jgi:hypothetical protein
MYTTTTINPHTRTCLWRRGDVCSAEISLPFSSSSRQEKMIETTKKPSSDHEPSPSAPHTGQFVRSRWSHVLALADQLRQNTAVQKNEQLRKYAFNIPSNEQRATAAGSSVVSHTDHVKSFENALLFAKTGNFNLDNLTDRFVELKQTFNHMLELNKNDIQQVILATSITKTALLVILRSVESIIEVMTKGTRKYPTLHSLISYIRSQDNELPIQGRLLVEWYNAADVLDLLVNDPDWLVQPRKAHWAMQICNETLTWTRGIFNENYRSTSVKRPIFDQEDSVLQADE